MKNIIQKSIWRAKVVISDHKFKQQIKKDIKQGYILSDGTPIKCYKCKSKKLEKYNYDCIEHTICEYSVRCEKCGQILGHWAYGSWQL